MFEDEEGRRCAVAHLIAASGNEVLVRRTRATRNLARVPDMDDSDLVSWASRHGLSVDELAQIQPGYMSDETDLARIVVVLIGFGFNSCLLALVGLVRRTRIWIRVAAGATTATGVLLVLAAVQSRKIHCVGEGITYCYRPSALAVPILLFLSACVVFLGFLWVRRGAAPLRTSLGGKPMGQGL